MKRITYLFVATLCLLQLWSCEADFTPNADWKEVPVVYCVLNPDDTVAWVRVQRCYLANDNLYNYTDIADSTNYPQGSLDVKLLQWRAKDTLRSQLVSTGVLERTFDFTYTDTINKESGLFGYRSQPMYGCQTGKLPANKVYQLIIIKRDSGDTLVTATTTLLENQLLYDVPQVGGKVAKVNDFAEGSRMALFKFVGTNKNCALSWNTWKRGRLYEPRVRFFYMVNGETKYVDVKCNSVHDQGNSFYANMVLSEGAYFEDIKQALTGDTATKVMVHKVGVIVESCNEDLNAYIASVNALHSGNQSARIYTNIEHGIGVFASRRSYMTMVPSDSAVGPGTYVNTLWDLGVGFEKNTK